MHRRFDRIQTERLILRRWLPSDRAPFAVMNADPEVMRYFPAKLDRETSDVFADRIDARLERQGFGLWALERRDTGEFIGFVGLSVPRRALPFMPCVEIGWRLAAAHWGHGFASEGAQQVLKIGFEHFALDEIVSFTSLVNRRSRAVMERIGMRDSGEDFEHPALPVGHPLRMHCLYRIRRGR